MYRRTVSPLSNVSTYPDLTRRNLVADVLGLSEGAASMEANAATAAKAAGHYGGAGKVRWVIVAVVVVVVVVMWRRGCYRRRPCCSRRMLPLLSLGSCCTKG